MASCFVCDKHRGKVETPGGELFRDDLVYVSHGKVSSDSDTCYPGVLFIEPLRHVDGVADLTDSEAQRIGSLATRAARALRDHAGATRVYTAVAGHHVAHYHMWVVPRYAKAPPDLWGIELTLYPGAPRATSEELLPLCMAVKQSLADQSAAVR